MTKMVDLVIRIPEETYKSIIKSDIEVAFYRSADVLHNSPISIMDAIRTGTLLPKEAEILTKEAYSDLCLRASRSIEWHPYPQEKPSVIGYYLVTTDGTSNDVIDIAWFDAEMAGLLQWNKASDIFAWAYLPKPYEEGAEE